MKTVERRKKQKADYESVIRKLDDEEGAPKFRIVDKFGESSFSQEEQVVDSEIK